MQHLTKVCILQICESGPKLCFWVGLQREEKVPQACCLRLRLQLLMLGRNGPGLLFIEVPQLLLDRQHFLSHKLGNLRFIQSLKAAP